MNYDKILLPIYNALVSGASIQKMINMMRIHIGNPIALCNCNLRPIAWSKGDDIDDYVWNSVTSTDENVHYQFEEFGLPHGLPDKVNSSTTPVLIDDERLVHRYMNKALFYQGNVIGNVVLLEYYRDFVEEDYTLLNHFSKILAFSESEIVSEFAQDPNAALAITQLLSGAQVSEQTIARYLFEPKESLCYAVAVLNHVQQTSHRTLILEQQMLQREYPPPKP